MPISIRLYYKMKLAVFLVLAVMAFSAFMYWRYPVWFFEHYGI